VRHLTRFIAAVLVAFAGCQQAVAEQRPFQQGPRIADKHTSKARKLRDPAKVKAADSVGLYRWYSGMQMGLFWASVLNKKHEALRFVAHNKEGAPVGWEPYIDLAGRKLSGEDGMLNLVVGDQSVTFNYTVKDGEPQIERLASDGRNSTARVLRLIRTASGKPVCLELPDIDYVTCFSTKGAAEAMEGDAWLP
jgi:hypothetical protein